MTEKLMLIGILILQVITIGAIVKITDDVKAVRKLVTYLKENESSVDNKFYYIKMKLNHMYEALQNLLDLKTSIEEQVKTIQEYLKKEIEKPGETKLALFKLDDRLRKSNKLMAALTRTTLATETTVEKLAKPKIHQKWSDRNFRNGIKSLTDDYLDERSVTDVR